MLSYVLCKLLFFYIHLFRGREGNCKRVNCQKYLFGGPWNPKKRFFTNWSLLLSPTHILCASVFCICLFWSVCGLKYETFGKFKFDISISVGHIISFKAWGHTESGLSRLATISERGGPVVLHNFASTLSNRTQSTVAG